jgi:hypothetical protein
MNINKVASCVAIAVLAVVLLSLFKYAYKTAGSCLYKIDRITGEVLMIRGPYEFKVGPMPPKEEAPSAPLASPVPEDK